MWTIKARDARRIRAAETKYMKNQQDILGQNIKEIKNCRGIIYIPSVGKYRITEESGYNV
jgi:hypothetical protein